jgi:hypothetical protein
MRHALTLGRRITICTVYNGALEPERATIARVGLALFNDVILRTAIDLRPDVLELRSVCTERADYANPIEPSSQGGLKIARAIRVRWEPLTAAKRCRRVWGKGGPSMLEGPTVCRAHSSCEGSVICGVPCFM